MVHQGGEDAAVQTCDLPRNYGSELEELVGQGDSRGVMESEVTRMVTETLLADPRTDSVDQFTFDWNQSSACSRAGWRVYRKRCLFWKVR